MAASVIAPASLTIPVAGRTLRVAAMVADAEVAAALQSALAALADAVAKERMLRVRNP
jgi:hypothetical protein